MTYAIESDELPIQYIPKFREYGLRVLDGGSSVIALNFCPWCGEKLPDSLRMDWFAQLEKRGIDPTANETIPPEFETDQWYTFV